MAYLKKSSKNKQIDCTQKDNRYAQTEITFNELDINILKERIKLLETENDKLKKENATLRKHLKPLSSIKDNKALIIASPLKQNATVFNSKHKGCMCKGNCANKICGCMKRELQCSESCKCNQKVCKNKLQELNKENKRENLVPLANEKQPTESLSSVDEIFYDASEPDLENLTFDLSAVRKLTYNTDEDTPERDSQLSVIQENSEESHHIQKQIGEQVKKVKKNHGDVRKDRRESSSQDTEQQNVEVNKVNKTRKKSVSKDTDTNTKKPRKGSKSSRTASVEIETEEKIPKEILEYPMINSRNRKNRGGSKSEELDDKKDEVKEEKKCEKQSKNKIPEKVKPIAKSKKEVSSSPNVKRISISVLASSRESISNLKLPNNWSKIRSSISIRKNKEPAEEENSRNMRSTRNKKNAENSLKNIVNKSTRAVSNEEISVKALQSQVRGLRRSVSSGTVATETIALSMHKKETVSKSKLNSKYKSKDKEIEAPRVKILNRSLSSDTLSNKPLKKLIQKVSSSFRRSNSMDIVNKPQQKDRLEDSQNLTLKSVKEISNELNNTKNSTFDPMQPTRELSRSPLPPVAIPRNPEFGIYSPQLYGRYLNQPIIKVGSPTPEILQDLQSEEVDLQTFNSKLRECRKCKRKFLPHRLELHEAVCKKM